MPIEVTMPAADVERFCAAGYWSDATLWSMVEDWVRRRPDSVVMVDAQRRITWAELRAESERLAGGLHALGIAKGDVVGIVLPNSIQWLVAHLAVTRCAAVFLPLHLAFRHHEFRQLLNIAGARAVIVPMEYRGAAFTQIVDDVGAALPEGLLRIVSLNDAAGSAPAGWRSLEELAEDSGPTDFPPIAPGDAFSITFTSGTTGEPKGAIHTTYTSLCVGPGNYAERGLTENDACFCLSPYAFSFAQESVYGVMSRGAASIAADRVGPQEFCRIVEREGVSFVNGPPAFITSLYHDGAWRTHDLSSVRLILIGGTTLVPTVVRAIEECFPNATPLTQWGMTECFGMICTDVKDGPEVVIASVGRTSRGAEAAVLDEAGRELGAGQVGELAVRGASLMWGYWGRPDLNAASRTPEGWFRTGDLATHDGNGYFQFVSRLKEVISRGGVKVYPAEVEAILTEHEDIIECAVLAYPDERLGERACLAVVPTAGRGLDLTSVTTYLERRGLARFKFPERIEVVDALPRNPSNKVDKLRLAEQLNISFRSPST